MQTERLTLLPLNKEHASFIFELLNTDGWKKFIGDRNIKTNDDALAYINRINSNSNINYWAVQLRSDDNLIGLVTLVKREHLDYPDIGFAFLPQYSRAGYAYEASLELLSFLTVQKTYQKLQAITLPANIASIKLLERLGFAEEGTTNDSGETLLVYSKQL